MSEKNDTKAKINPAELASIINNTDREYTIGQEKYILLIKEDESKLFSNMYVTDCESNFWLNKMDTTYF
jgi:hypothetical protein